MENKIIDVNVEFEQKDEREQIDINSMIKYAKKKNIKVEELTDDEKNMFYIGIYNDRLNKLVYKNPNYYKYDGTQ